MSYNMPNSSGYFEKYGGAFVAEFLIDPLKELLDAYDQIANTDDFKNELNYYLKEYVGRETPLYYARNLTEYCNGAKIYLKREDLNHTGAHKINNSLAQVLLAKKMGKEKLIAETGAGQHGVATATACALLGLKCKVFMGYEDVKRQKLNVFRMRLLGAEVVEVHSGSKLLKDAVNEALKYWISNIDDTSYIIGSAIGPHPYPMMVRNFQKVIGEETKAQILKLENRLPDKIIACIGGGSNAIGMFYPFIEDLDVELIGVEAAGFGLDSGKHAASINKGEYGILHGNAMYMLQDDFGQVEEVYSISAGLDYPGVGPEHCHLNDIGRASYKSISDKEAISAFQLLSECEGIIPALESAHALAQAIKTAGEMRADQLLVVNLSGRGDKDVEEVLNYIEEAELYEDIN